MGTVKTIGPGIRYFSFGHGQKNMVVIPGLSIGYVTDSAAAIEAAFSAFAEEYTVYLFDIRDPVPENYTIAQMGEDLTEAIRALGLEKVFLYGCSMGGMQAIYIAGTHPELVEKAAVASTACRANAHLNSLIGGWIRLAEEGRCRDLTADMGRKIYSQAVYEGLKSAFEAMADGLTDALLTRFIRTASAIRDMDITAQASAVRCPMLILGSLGDQVMTPDTSALIAERTGGEVYLYPDVFPHAVYDEAPDLRERVQAFFGAESC